MMLFFCSLHSFVASNQFMSFSVWSVFSSGKMSFFYQTSDFRDASWPSYFSFGVVCRWRWAYSQPALGFLSRELPRLALKVELDEETIFLKKSKKGCELARLHLQKAPKLK